MSNINASFALSDLDVEFLDTHQAVSFLVINLILTVIALCVYCIMIRILSKETSGMNNLLLYYARANIVFLPLMLIFVDILIPFLYPLSQHFGVWFCHINMFLALLLAIYIYLLFLSEQKVC